MEISRGRFKISPSEARTQQSLESFYEVYLPRHHPDLISAFDHVFSKPDGGNINYAKEMALRSCQAVTAWNFLRSGGKLEGVALEEFVDKIWPAFDFVKARSWLRPIMTRIVREEFGIRLVSAGVKWLDKPITGTTESEMISAGYCGDHIDFEYYMQNIHSRNLVDIISATPALVTVKSPVGAQVAHTIFAWDIHGSTLLYANSDERDMPKASGFCEGSLLMLESEEARVGAVTILI
jgi:hypothetical protein